MTATDPVDLWRGLHGSRDWRGVVSAGYQLCDALERLRAAWRLRSDEHRTEITKLDARIDELEARIATEAAPSDLERAVQAWHETEHADGWAVCPHPVCRAAGAG